MPVSISAISYYLPRNIVDNEELSRLFPEWTAAAIEEKTGIRQRHTCDYDEIASDCAVKAAEKLFEEHQIDRKRIQFLLFCTQTADYVSPTTACLIQKRLNLPNHIGALDINLGCSGFVYSLSVAKGLIVGLGLDNVLLLTSEVLSKYIHRQDKSARTLFGDAGAATLLRNTTTEAAKGIGNFVFGTDGHEDDTMIFRNRGFRFPLLSVSGLDYRDEYGNVFNDNYFHMNGPAVFTFSLKRVPPMVDELLEKSGLRLQDIDLFIFHQANNYMLETLRRKIKIPSDRFFVYIRDVGNTVSSTIPIALYEAQRCGKIQPGSRVLLAAFGVGLSWAATIVEF